MDESDKIDEIPYDKDYDSLKFDPTLNSMRAAQNQIRNHNGDKEHDVMNKHDDEFDDQFHSVGECDFYYTTDGWRMCCNNCEYFLNNDELWVNDAGVIYESSGDIIPK